MRSWQVKHVAETEHVSLVEAEARIEKAGALSPKEGRYLRLQERKESGTWSLRKDCSFIIRAPTNHATLDGSFSAVSTPIFATKALFFRHFSYST